MPYGTVTLRNVVVIPAIRLLMRRVRKVAIRTSRECENVWDMRRIQGLFPMVPSTSASLTFSSPDLTTVHIPETGNEQHSSPEKHTGGERWGFPPPGFTWVLSRSGGVYSPLSHPSSHRETGIILSDLLRYPLV